MIKNLQNQGGGSSNKTEDSSEGITGSTVLTIDQIPNHTHFTYGGRTSTENSLTNSSGEANGWIPDLGGKEWYHNVNTYVGGSNGHTHTTPSRSHNFMVPYLTVYMWKRTA